MTQQIFTKLAKLISFKGSNKKLLFLVFLLSVSGLIILMSASSVVAYKYYNDIYYFVRHQLFSFGIGIAIFFFFANFNYHILNKYAFGALLFSIALLILVFIPGISHPVNGSRSWIQIFGTNLQPAEFVKISFLVYLSAWFAKRSPQRKRMVREQAEQKIIPFLIIYAVIAVLMLLQPDLGTLAIITIISFTVYYIAGGKIKHIIAFGLIGVIGLSLLLSVNEYQRDRFRCVIDPNFSVQDKCYQVHQSLIAVGSGGVIGRGLGASRQKFLYLPEVYNDFIFSIIGEELGFVFSVLIIFLFFLLFYQGYQIAKYAHDDFGKFLAFGIVTWLAIQTIINIGGIINLIPMTGVPLPFISYGGTAVIAFLAGMGILTNISKKAN